MPSADGLGQARADVGSAGGRPGRAASRAPLMVRDASCPPVVRTNTARRPCRSFGIGIARVGRPERRFSPDYYIYTPLLSSTVSHSLARSPSRRRPLAPAPSTALVDHGPSPVSARPGARDSPSAVGAPPTAARAVAGVRATSPPDGATATAIAAADAVAATAAALTEPTSLHDRRADTLVVAIVDTTVSDAAAQGSTAEPHRTGRRRDTASEQRVRRTRWGRRHARPLVLEMPARSAPTNASAAPATGGIAAGTADRELKRERQLNRGAELRPLTEPNAR